MWFIYEIHELTIQPKIFMVHVLFLIEARPFLPYGAQSLTDV